ncbi:NmrA family NAD(P)-binding protein [Actinocrispum wychmicini]|uniref:Uncharacterized protein YbjT (DUF2867 family) n=1 Tax=Actinocrispum wychmicini TaxID=1213861 RepID=A0A4R2JUN3_9PSEU|nr:NmrA family NAD(P)-binding protein [Actinocrispum wychmicini]TCO61028.1 uncharacterized protein YbjT (DUF2867 family) [Actinocrispum wychmicini]
MILVTGATGKQGGATAHALLARGESVRALVRDPHTPAARALADAGVALAVGDLADRASVDTALSGVDGVFSVQARAENEAQCAITLADAAAAAGVEHIVHTSMAGADRIANADGWGVKWQIEEHIRALGLPATMLRPVRFMENLPNTVDVHTGQLRDLWAPDQQVQMIAVHDIGWFAAAAFADPDTYAGHAWELAGDELTHERMIAAARASTGRDITYVHENPDEFATRNGYPIANIRAVVEFLADGWQADIPALRALHPDLMDFDAWLTHTGKAHFDTRLTS